MCHSAIQPIDPEWAFLNEGYYDGVERVLRCPSRFCQRLFIARYGRRTNGNYYHLVGCYPTEILDCVFSPELKAISPDYCDIYNEAHKAEQLQLLLVCGPGYRKALEFLIKDYVSRLHPLPEEKEKIEKMPLMACIKDYVTDSRIKNTAERAAWLGNDETHYVRKWEDKDLKDLKKFILLTCHWIESEELTKDAVATMPEGKK
jgi:hypothetical protein